MGMRPLALLLTTLSALASPVLADDDHARARAALERGDILPLADILASATRDFPGKLLEAELEAEDGRLIYELELLAPGGRVVELAYDARTGELLSAEGPGLERLLRPSPEQRK